MTEVVVTRNGQITLTKDIREKLGIDEGDLININVVGNSAVVSKRDPSAFDKADFLPENFEKTLRKIRAFSVEQRLKRIGII